MIVDLIIGAIATGGAKTVADVIKIIAKQFKEILILGKKAVAATGKAIKNLFDEIIAIFAKIKAGVKNLKPFLDEVLEFLRTFLGAIPKQLTEYLTKFGITTQKIPQQVLYSGIPIKVGDEIYALIKSGKEIFRGTKKEIEELAEKLKKMSDKEAKEFIDNIIKRRNALTKWAGKFDENFVNHLSGDIAIEKITIFFKDLYYLGTKGQGGHWLNKFLKVEDLVPPPNYTSVAEIPADTPFRARVSIKSLKGKFFPKDAVSTMFPKNWSKERIMEEVAFVYEKTVAKGINKRPKQKGDLFDKYESLSTSGFKIRLEIDGTGKIINAYPIL